MLLIKIYSEDAFSTSLHIWTFIWSNVSQNGQDSQYIQEEEKNLSSNALQRLPSPSVILMNKEGEGEGYIMGEICCKYGKVSLKKL